MKRVLVAVALIVSLLGIAGWHASVLAQTPVGGEVRTVTLPHGRAAAMSPNGQYLAAVTPPDTALCVYDVATMAEVSCADLSGLSAGIRTEDIVWSPDSTRIAFSEHAFRLFVDGDLWVMDAATGSLTNLTDDGYVGRILESGSDNSEQFFFDVAPAWTPDSQFITFSRTEYAGPGLARNTIAQVPASGGSVEELAEISDIPGAWYFKGQWSPDGQQLYYSFNESDPDSTDTGIWVYQRATGEIRKLAVSDDAELGPLVLMQVSPAGNRLLAYYPMALMQSAYWGKSVLRFVDPVTGDVSQVPDPAPESEVFEGTWLATFSPDGAYLLQAVGVSSASRAFWVTDLASGVSTRVTGEIADAMPIEYALGPVWGADGTVFVAQALDGAIFFSIEGVGLDVAQPEATSTPVASHVVENGDAGAPVGGAVRQVELPEGRAIAMSPDGRYLAAAVPPQASLCVYNVATMAEVSCADLSVLNTMLRIEDVVWSPDSTRLAFSEQTFVTYKDGDLWVMDAATGELTNLTDDHYDGAIIDLHDDAGDAEFFADVAPAWTPDGQFITFSRSSSGEGGVSTNVIAQVSATGGEVATLAPVSEAPGIFYYRGQWSPDGTRFYYSVTNLDLSHPDNGIWTYDPATGATALLARSDDAEFGPLVLREVSPAGDRLLAYYPSATGGFVVLQRSPLRLVDANTGALSAVPQPPAETDLFEGTWIATFSPDGQYLLQAVGLDSGARDFWITHLETGASTEVATDLESAVPVAFGLGPVWGTDGTVFVAWNVIGAYFFPIDGAGLATTASPVTEQSTQASTIFAPGDTALTTGMTPIFAAPDANATVVHILAPNNTVQILGEPVTNEQGTWYPVLDPETQIIGYVQATQLGQPT